MLGDLYIDGSFNMEGEPIMEFEPPVVDFTCKDRLTFLRELRGMGASFVFIKAEFASRAGLLLMTAYAREDCRDFPQKLRARYNISITLEGRSCNFVIPNDLFPSPVYYNKLINLSVSDEELQNTLADFEVWELVDSNL
jgi:hypothetical protein